MNEVMYKLGAIEAMLKAMSDKMDMVQANHKNHEERISKLETANIRQHAITATVGAIGAFTFELIKWVTHS